MLKTTDLYLGTFLILSGFALSLFNLRRVVKSETAFSSVLLSENIILICIGITFVSRSLYSINPSNVEIFEMERAAELNFATKEDINCGFHTLLLGYGPLVVSMVNSFLTLVIDNYMHYKIVKALKKKNDENVVQEIGDAKETERKLRPFVCSIWKKYFSFVTIALQWIIPTITTLAMYPIDVKEISMPQARLTDSSCMAMLDLSHKECLGTTNYTMDLSKYIQSPVNFFQGQNNEERTNGTDEIDTVLSNVLQIINNFHNHTDFNYVTIKSLRQPKTDEHCMKMCYMDNKSLLSYIFMLGFVIYFIPITISAIILTKIHLMEVAKPKMKTHVTRELLFNILFWSPVMFDTLISLIFCSYSMHGVRTSMFNVIANVYQTLKNFINTKYFKENAIVPL